MKPQPLSIAKLLLAVIIFISVGTAFGVMAYIVSLKKSSPVAVQPKVSPVSEPTPIIKSETADWKTYRNEEYGLEFNYPNNYCIQEGLVQEQYFIEIFANCPPPKHETSAFAGFSSSYAVINIAKDTRNLEEFIKSLPIDDDVNKKSEKISVNNTAGYKEHLEQTKEGPPLFTSDFWYFKNDKLNYLYTLENSGSDIIDQILPTFRFTTNNDLVSLYRYDWSNKDCTDFIPDGPTGVEYKEKCSKWMTFGDLEVYQPFHSVKNFKDFYCDKDNFYYAATSSFYVWNGANHSGFLGCEASVDNSQYENVLNYGYVCYRQSCTGMCGDLPPIESCEFRNVFVADLKSTKSPGVYIGQNWGKDCISKDDVEKINKMDYSDGYEKLDSFMEDKYNSCKVKYSKNIKEFINYIKGFDLSK